MLSYFIDKGSTHCCIAEGPEPFFYVFKGSEVIASEPFCLLCICFLVVLFLGLLDGGGELVGAGGGLVAAGDAVKEVVDLVCGFAFYGFGDALEVAVAAAEVFYVVDGVVIVYVEVYLY